METILTAAGAVELMAKGKGQTPRQGTLPAQEGSRWQTKGHASSAPAGQDEALTPVDWPSVFRRAHRLSRRHAATLAVRSLDLLHVALALQMNAGEFLTFDDRQSQTAKAEGLAVLP